MVSLAPESGCSLSTLTLVPGDWKLSGLCGHLHAYGTPKLTQAQINPNIFVFLFESKSYCIALVAIHYVDQTGLKLKVCHHSRKVINLKSFFNPRKTILVPIINSKKDYLQ